MRFDAHEPFECLQQFHGAVEHDEAEELPGVRWTVPGDQASREKMRSGERQRNFETPAHDANLRVGCTRTNQWDLYLAFQFSDNTNVIERCPSARRESSAIGRVFPRVLLLDKIIFNTD